MVRSGTHKRIWYDALDFEAYVRSHTALDFYMLQGGVPETVMLGVTSYISQFFEHRLYYWVMFRYKPIQCPDENPVLDRYLGPAIDVGPSITDKIMTHTVVLKRMIIPDKSIYH